ncbi:MAG: carboxypeptidase regulatory-like domain-containing protein [Acidobacteria bacterium]|nr:MAG: carboxypeptidase regulatory-like domain-containing protein [Acidobacteriota bacterium]
MRTSRNFAARGRVVFEEGPVPAIPFKQVRVSARPVDFDSAPMNGGPLRTSMNDDGTFEIRNLSGWCVIQPDIASADWSLKRVTAAGKDVTETPIEFKDKDVDGIEVVLTARNPTLAGSVLDERGRPVGNFSVIVFAVDPRRWTFPSRFVALGRPNQQGRYKITGLPPDEYLAIALAPMTTTDWQDPEFLEGLRSFAQPVTLSEGEARTLDLRLRRQ